MKGRFAISTCLVGIVTLSICASAKTTTLTVYDSNADPIFYKELPELYMKKNPGVKINIIPTTTSIHLLYAGGKAPDVMQLAPQLYDSLRRSGMLLSIDPYMEKYKFSDDQFNMDIEKWYYKGKLYGLPLWTGMGYAMAYNRNLFSELGLSYPDDESKWSDLTNALRRLTVDLNGDGKLDRWAIEAVAGVNEPNNWLTFVWQNGGEFYNKDESQCTIDSPQAIEALEYYSSIGLKYKAFTTGEAGKDPFYNRKAGLWFTYANLGRLGRKDLKFELETAPMPYNTKKAMGSQALLSYGISRTSKNADEAFKYIRFVLTDKDALKLTSKYSTPSTKVGMDIWRDTTPRDLQQKLNGWFVRLPKYAHPRPFDAKWEYFYARAVVPEFSKMMEGKQSPQATAKQISQGVNRLLKEYYARLELREKK